MHRLDFGLYPHPKEFWGNGVRTHVDYKGKIPSTRGSEKCRTHDTASRRTASTMHYKLSYSSPELSVFFFKKAIKLSQFESNWSNGLSRVKLSHVVELMREVRGGETSS